jgi:hypothetical protein
MAWAIVGLKCLRRRQFAFVGPPEAVLFYELPGVFHLNLPSRQARIVLRFLEKCITLECSHTDVGDPWCIIYDEEHHRTILHIARIDGQYVVVWPLKERSAKTALMAVAVQMAADGLTTYARDAGRS